MTAAPADDPLVLLVDDYADAREMYAEFLVSSGYRVVEAADGEEALRKTASLAPDVILLDVSLPLIDGREVTKRLKADPATAGIPVVLLSGMPPEYVKGTGADSWVAKPCDPEALLAEVQRLLAARRKPGPI
jgi:two-component system, cell cycle response regulator DivK